ncbi:ABC transporter ATP-binding protein [Photobacterium phosphoreum]|uniref:ATP-binding cassette domain-containing protein n=1 Tax=Photobacterium phosphoreum TaxID=659 RepID=UPI000D158DE7|nr:ATP-binding cassette domain-containing protein [Photobacterium phosphoreum]PSU73075.1 ABC transporter ATP-binding protein [Photobacterium phosphoreum]PSU74642.1 ABC transporter ATP-binding protein [Photobacterium phosphoreum]PSW32505.1 ABC transporter ATP-binding protein [Photobacterium phosphoreum]
MCSKALVLTDINKWFGPIHALRNINLSINEGEVIALLGDNGAGKSTLIKLIAGIESFDSGHITIQDKSIDKQGYNVKNARNLGIETVYQSGSLGEQQSVWRNLFLGRHIRTRLGFIDQKQERQQAQQLLQKLDFRGVGANIDSCVSQLSGGERQGLAIGRAMLFNAKLVILDEPTTALSLGEVEKVLCFIETLKAQQRACLLITHNMNDAYRVADRFVVMDRGTIVAEYHKADMDQQSLQQALLSAVGRGAA